MDYVYTNLLTDDDMRRILAQRQLILPDVDQMSHEQLLKVFNSFVVPMEKRGERKHKTNDMQMETQHLISKLKRVLPPPVNECASKLSRVTLNVNFSEASLAKRNVECITNGPAVSSACKRMKITWP